MVVVDTHSSPRKPRVSARLAPTYEKPLSTYGDYRPWRLGVLANIERTYSMVS